MSAQSGVLYFDHSAIPPSLPALHRARLQCFGSDAGGEFVGPGVLLASRVLGVTPHDRCEEQPVVSVQGGVLTWDGRLDNRSDLLTQLWSGAAAEVPDGRLVGAAIERWGMKALGRIVGDWSLAFWDPSDETVTLASDYMGTRPLNFHVGRDRLEWATSLDDLLERLDTSDLDPRFVVGYLTGVHAPDATPYAGVYSVRPGCAITVGRDGKQRQTRFWSPVADRIEYRRAERYEEHLRHVFEEAIRSRLRAKNAVWIELSGGLDSSANVCMADRLVRRGEVDAPGLRTLSRVTTGSPESDERRFIQVVEEQCQWPSRHVTVEELNALPVSRQASASPYESSQAMRYMLEMIRMSGSQVLMTGHPGDLVMGNNIDDSHSLASLAAQGRFVRFARGVYEWSFASKKTVWAVGLNGLRHVSRRHLAASTRRAYLTAPGSAKNRPGSPRETFLVKDEWLLTWEQIVSEQQQAYDCDVEAGKRQLAWRLMEFALSRNFESVATRQGIFHTHPFLHRPLVEFALGIPAEILCPPGRPRALMRSAFAGFMPERILRRFSKGYAAPAAARALSSAVSRFTGNDPESFALVQRGYVDAQKLTRALAAAKEGKMSQVGLTPLLNLEHWLTAREEQRIAASA